MSFNPHQWYLMGSLNVPFLPTDAVDVYSLRRVYNTWNKALIEIRRSSDNALVYVFPDSNGVISLSSLVSTSISVPGALTLGSWIGSNDGYVREMLSQNYANNYDINNMLVQGTSTLQPKIINAGTLITKNGKVTMDFLSDTRYFTRLTPISSLNSGNSFTVVTVSSNEVSNSSAAILNTTNTLDDRFTQFNDSRTNRLASLIRNSLGDVYLSNLLSQQNTTNQKLITSVVTSSNLSTYYNGTFQTTTTWSGTYTNDAFRVGVQLSLASPLNGTIQEIIIYDSDKTSEIGKIHDAINNYYTIY